ncbi:MAG: FAD:protein FMN transferase [Lachnospiraceae bacterium]|nr:FAD:protein FMN transferase [Lachnospiraceae bacterium]
MIRKNYRWGAFFLCLFWTASLVGCAADNTQVSDTDAAQEVQESDFFAMDTYMSVKVWGDTDATLVAGLEEEILRVEALLSVTEEGSDLYQINHGEGTAVTVSQETADLLNTALSWCESTDGALDISLYPLSVAWGFSSASEEGYQVVSEEERAELLTLCGWQNVMVDGLTVSIPDGGGLDLGAVAKGYATDTCVSYLEENGISTALLSLGGNIYALGSKEDGSDWKIGIQDPEDESGSSYVGVLELSDKAVVTSGSYQRYFEEDGIRYHHILDGATGAPADSGLLSVTVITDSGLTADCLSTAFFVMGLEESAAYWRDSENLEVVWVTEDGDLYITEGLEDIFAVSEGWEATVISR